MAKSGGGDYFKRSKAIINAKCINARTTKDGKNTLGPYGTFCRYLVDNHSGLLYKGWWAALAIHAVEAFVSLKVCSNKGINNMTTRCLWFFQTFLFGFASLGLLIKYKPERRKKN
uniref:Transmembrane protein 254 n=1 Tax=Takifugu rubripes TaxID=31033 RepID=A0A674NRF3_TAKRU